MQRSQRAAIKREIRRVEEPREEAAAGFVSKYSSHFQPEEEEENPLNIILGGRVKREIHIVNDDTTSYKYYRKIKKKMTAVGLNPRPFGPGLKSGPLDHSAKLSNY